MTVLPGEVGPLGPVGTGPYCDMWAVVDAGDELALLLRRRRQKKMPTPIRARTATPPTAPPAMAPTLVLLPPTLLPSSFLLDEPVDVAASGSSVVLEEELSEVLVLASSLDEGMCVDDQAGS
jgi:hypothetical protein